MTVDEEKRKCSFIHSLPTGIYQLRVCLRSHLSVGFFSPPRRDTVCVCCMNAARRLACEVADSFITACAHRETAAFTRREEERRTETRDRPGLLSGRSVSVQPSPGRRCEKMGGTAAVSFNEHSLLSSAFNLQARPALLHPVPSIHARKARRLKLSLQVIPNRKSSHSQTFHPTDLGRV